MNRFTLDRAVALSLFAVVLVVGLPSVLSVMDSYIESDTTKEYIHDAPLEWNGNNPNYPDWVFTGFLSDGLDKAAALDNDIARIVVWTDAPVVRVGFYGLETPTSKSGVCIYLLTSVGDGYYEATMDLFSIISVYQYPPARRCNEAFIVTRKHRLV